EHALFDPNAAAKLPHEAYRCDWLKAAAANVAGMAREIDAEWRDYGPRLASSAPGGAYKDAREATQDLFKSLHAAVELVADHKLALPLGASSDKARPRRAESWRSETSLANVKENLAAAASLYDALAAGVGDAALDAELRCRFAAARAAADAIPVSREAAVASPAERAKVERLRREAAELKDALANRLSAAL